MTLADYLWVVGLLLLTTLGMGLPLASRWTDDPLERLTAALMLGFTLNFLIGFSIYAANLPWIIWWLVPMGATMGLITNRHCLIGFWRDADTRQSLLGWLTLCLWTQGLLALVRNYNGGPWIGDWYEHAERSWFFLKHWPLNHVFLGIYPLTARPPLANIVTAGIESIAGPVFANTQVVLTLWASLVFFPAALWCRRMGSARLFPVLSVLLMLNPSFVQNSTFAWTKLQAVFFVLSGAYFVARALDENENGVRFFCLGVVALSAGLVAHYSAAPYFIVIALWWMVWRCRHKAWLTLAHESLIGLLIAAIIPGFWLGWSVKYYGIGGTFLSNTTVIDGATLGISGRITQLSYNLWTTLIPHPFRTVDYVWIAQANWLGGFRDYCFMISQVNLLAMLGTGGWFALAAVIISQWPKWKPVVSATAPAWVLPTIALGILLCVATNGVRDEWGVGHVCLQSISTLGIAVIAGNFPVIGKWTTVILIAGLCWDGFVNVGLHYALQLTQPSGEAISLPPSDYSAATTMNAQAKIVFGFHFLNDSIPVIWPIITALGLLLALAIMRARRALKLPHSISDQDIA